MAPTCLRTAVQQAIWPLLFEDPSSGGAALQYGSTPGFHVLRELLRDRMHQADGPHDAIALDQIVVTAGSNQLLHLVSECLLEPGDIVLCASPTYLVYMGLLAGLEARAVGVASDAQGMIPEALDEQFRRIDAAGDLGRSKRSIWSRISTIPAGATMSGGAPHRRGRVGQTLVAVRPIHVISDEAYRELRYWGDDIPSLAFAMIPATPSSSPARFPSPSRRGFGSAGGASAAPDPTGLRFEGQRRFRLAQLQPALDGQGAGTEPVGTPPRGTSRKLSQQAERHAGRRRIPSGHRWKGVRTGLPFGGCTSGWSCPSRSMPAWTADCSRDVDPRRRVVRAGRVLLSGRGRAAATQHDPAEFWGSVL
jgi:hypothetical protein